MTIIYITIIIMVFIEIPLSQLNAEYTVSVYQRKTEITLILLNIHIHRATCTSYKVYIEVYRFHFDTVLKEE